MSKRLKSYCVGHVLPSFPAPIAYEMLSPVPLGIPGECVIDDQRFGQGVDGASLAEYSQLFGLYEMLKAGDVVADELYLFQYRKFLSPNAGGSQATAPWVRVLQPHEADSVFPSPDQLEAVESRLIVGSLFDLGSSISSNYALVHVIDDLVMFSAACAACPAITPDVVRMLATQRGIIPSPALCYVKTDLFMQIMATLKSVWEVFSGSYAVRREGYQRRVAGYLMERLHSVLLCKWLMDGSEPAIHVWQRYVVAPQSTPVLTQSATV